MQSQQFSECHYLHGVQYIRVLVFSLGDGVTQIPYKDPKTNICSWFLQFTVGTAIVCISLTCPALGNCHSIA